MKRSGMLIKLEIKKYLKAFPRLFGAAVMLTLVVCGIGVMGDRVLNSTATDNVESLIKDMTAENKFKDSGEEKKAEENGKISAALVIQDDSRAMKLARSMLENMDSVNSTLTIQYVSEKEGKRLLERGEIVVLIIIRDDTMAGIMDGENIPVEIRFPKDSGYEAAIFKEIADAAVKMLSSAQASIYSVYDFYDAYGKYRLRSGAIERLNLAYIKTALSREEIYQESEVAVTGELSVLEYYICGGLVLFAMFFSVMLIYFMGRSGRDISVRLKMAGTGYSAQIAASLAGPSFICMIVFIVAGAVLTGLKIFRQDILKDAAFGQIWGAVFLMLPVALTVCAFALMVCRFTDNAMARVMIVFIVSLLQGLIAGCFIPKLLLPDLMEKIAGFLPAYYMIELLSGVFTGRISAGAIAMLFVFTMMFMEITVALESSVRGRRISDRRKLS